MTINNLRGAADNRCDGPTGTGAAAARRRIGAALRERRDGVERAIATRVFAISEPSETADPEYIEGLRASLGTALDFALEAIERGERWAPKIPTSLLAQARMAARSGVPLEAVLRRYLAGYSLVLEALLEAVDIAAEPGAGEALLLALRGQAAVFDRLVAAVSEEHRRETATLLRSTVERRAERVTRLLAGEPVDAEELGYRLDGFHLGLAGAGPDIEGAVSELATALSATSLTVPLAEGRAWAWLGSRHPFAKGDLDALLDRVATTLAPGATLAFGELGEGLEGWRLTHRQALAVLPTARRQGRRVVRYVDAGLLASVAADDLLLESLRQIFVAPLSEERDGGEDLREALRAYLGTGRNISSAAAALGLDRGTVRKRVRVAEERIGRPVDECAAELEIALRLAEHSERASLCLR